MQTDTTSNEVVKEFFIAGYLDHDYDRVMGRKKLPPSRDT